MPSAHSMKLQPVGGSGGPDAASSAPAAGSVAASGHVPLAVDLDGTLVCSDLLFESALIAIRRRPSLLLRLPGWLLHGRAALKQQLAREGLPDAHSLPYRQDLLEYLREQKRLGRRIVLVTAADRRVAEAVSAETGLFDAVYASDGHSNLAGKCKRDRLTQLFGPGGFDYIGNSRRDLPVWQTAHAALIAGAHRGLLRAIKKTRPVERVFSAGDGTWRDVLRQLRPHQWLKNLLVFLPLLGAHRLVDPELLPRALLAFVAFTLCASGVYVLNDLLDLPTDRRHPHKRLRPLASGRVPIRGALGLLGMLLIGAVLVGLQLPGYFLPVLAAYFVTTLAYSMGLKDHAVLDVLILAGGYAARVAAGSVAVGIAPSAWLLAFCMFLFFSLALVKRFAELVALRPAANGKAHARGYFLDDAGVVAAQGIASGYIGVLVLALYTNSAMVQAIHGRYWVFWGICLLLWCWISHLWLMADRGLIADDPVVFALRNGSSRLLLLGIVALSLVAI